MDEAARIARGAFADGADYLNIRRRLSFDAFKAAVDVAHEAGCAVVAQPIGPAVYAREAVLAGADILEHAAGVSYSIVRDPSRWKGWGNRELDLLDVRPYAEMDEAKAADLIKFMVDRHTYLEPDMVAQGRGLPLQSEKWEAEDRKLLSDPDLAYIPEGVKVKWLDNYTELRQWPADDREQLKTGFANYQKFIGMFVQAGGTVLAGDDVSYSGWAVPGIGLLRELELMVEAGLTPMQAIMTATRNPAEAYRVLDRLGTVEPGKLADLLGESTTTRSPTSVTSKGSRWSSRTARPWSPLIIATSRTLSRATSSKRLPTGTPASNAIRKRESDDSRIDRSNFGLRPALPRDWSLTPQITDEGGPSLTLTIKGVNFTAKSAVYWGGKPIPATRASETEMHATIDRSMIAQAGIFPVQVKNPGPSLSQPKLGGYLQPRLLHREREVAPPGRRTLRTLQCATFCLARFSLPAWLPNSTLPFGLPFGGQPLPEVSSAGLRGVCGDEAPATKPAVTERREIRAVRRPLGSSDN